MKKLLLVAALVAAGCSEGAGGPPSPPPPPPPPAPPKADVTPPPKAPSLLNPADAKLTAPAEFKVKFQTTKGDFTVQVKRDWAPKGADRFYNLVKLGYFDGCKFFRVISGFMVQFGINGDPKANGAWREARIDDDPVKQSNTRGMITFATGGPNTRTTQVFINFANNARLDSTGFSPFGQISDGMQVVDSLFAGYGEGAPRGRGPRQDLVQSAGNEYLEKEFPQLDAIKSARVVD